MLPKKNRISRALFSTLLKDGAFFHSQNLSFRLTKQQKERKEGSKFSFVVSKKVSKSAVVRNRLRRRGYSVLQTILGKEKMSTGGILGAFFLKKGVENVDFLVLQNEIVSMLRKSKIL